MKTLFHDDLKLKKPFGRHGLSKKYFSVLSFYSVVRIMRGNGQMAVKFLSHFIFDQSITSGGCYSTIQVSMMARGAVTL